jgi:hypothetical protein
MPLQKIQFKPGFNKQQTATGAEGQWIDGDFVRFRYGEPEKIGGFQQLVSTTLSGPAREQHTWTALDGKKYAAIGTSKLLIIYYSSQFFDITPLGTALTSCTYTSTTGSATVTINKADHGLEVGDYIVFTSVTTPGSPTTGYTSASFTTNTFEVISVPTSGTFTVTMTTAETGTGVTAGGTITTTPYIVVGPVAQTPAYGYGTGYWGGTIPTSVTTQLNGAINAITTTITVDATVSFPTGTVGPPPSRIDIDTELITYTGKTATTFTGCTRGASGSTAASHSDNAVVANATSWVDWGEESNTTSTTLAPGSWSLDNFGQILVATIKNGQTFTWDPSVVGATSTRATIVSGAPTTSIMSIVSDRDRHLFLMGTETTIGTPSTQDPMFIRFSNQEDINTYAPTVTNTAGTFRLDTGNEVRGAIQGKDYIFVLTDQAAYVIQFVGPPFTFSVRQVGTNCGCIGQHAIIFAQGAVFWMGSSGGFFVYDGTVKQLPSLVEDFVFTDVGDNLGINYESGQIVYGYHNSLYNEVGWFYPKSGQTQIDRNVVYNYTENTWVTGSLARTTYQDADTFDFPYATQYIANGTPTFPTINGVTSLFGSTKYWEHESGFNEVDTAGNKTAISAFIKSGDYDISEQGLGGDGQLIMRVKRFVPDFKNLEGNAIITLFFRDYPSNSESTPSTTPPTITGPFTITSSTDKVDTRVRGRQVSLRIENNAVDETWRYGTLRLDIEAGGRR